MSYHDLSSCTLDADQREAESARLCEIIINNSDAPLRWTPTEKQFVEKMTDGSTVSVKQLFWLRDIKDKYL